MTPNKIFKENIEKILNGSKTEGFVRPRLSNGSLSHSYFVTNHVETHNLEEGRVPLITAKKIPWKSAIKEYLWIFQDQSNDLEILEEKHGITWWKPWDIGDGTIGKRYGATVAEFNQIDHLIYGLREAPYTRRHILNLYEHSHLQSSEGLAPCLFMHIFNVRGCYLDLMSVQRSSDYLVAGHINQFQAISLLFMIAKATGLKPGKFTWSVANLHIYENQLEQANILMEEAEKREDDEAPKLIFNPENEYFYDFKIEDFTLENYVPNPNKISFELSI